MILKLIIHRVARKRTCHVMLMALVLTCAVSCSDSKSSSGPLGPRVVVVGFDGMDPRLCSRLMDEGKLPNLAKMRDAGGFKPLGTSIPPQSPVAWSNFITGADPGVHGIFDFVHRDPKRQCAPYYSAAETVEGDLGWEVDGFNIPLNFWPFDHQPTETLLRREGIPFWDYLDEAGIDVHIYDIPANYPPSKSKHGHMCCLSGMGTPDLLGSLGGESQFFGEGEKSRAVSGGFIEPITFTGEKAKIRLLGPEHTFLQLPERVKVDVDVYRDVKQKAARLEVQGKTILLKEGEWSDWCRLDYELSMPPFLPASHAKGICRFYLQQVSDTFRLYVTPISIDPSDPAGQVISEPEDFVTDISDALGLFYTTGFQEDHKALSNKIFDDHEYHQQADYVLEERLTLFDYAKQTYDDGLLFFYFSSTDLQAHMFWWDSDKKHPIRTPEMAKKYHGVIEALYQRMDGVVGRVLAEYGDSSTVLVMSDHGFASFRRQFNLNTWLRQEGYIFPADCKSIMRVSGTGSVDWSRTTAYGLGLNGLYLNLQGREKFGIVTQRKRAAMLQEIKEKLLKVRDPEDGHLVVKEVYLTEEVYHGPKTADAPDLIVGYYRDYRASWSTSLGDISDVMVSDNDEAWSADHCMAADEVPGVIFSNKPIVATGPRLIDLAPTILQALGVSPPAAMRGKNLFEMTHTALAADGE